MHSRRAVLAVIKYISNVTTSFKMICICMLSRMIVMVHFRPRSSGIVLKELGGIDYISLSWLHLLVLVLQLFHKATFPCDSF